MEGQNVETSDVVEEDEATGEDGNGGGNGGEEVALEDLERLKAKWERGDPEEKGEVKVELAKGSEDDEGVPNVDEEKLDWEEELERQYPGGTEKIQRRRKRSQPDEG